METGLVKKIIYTAAAAFVLLCISAVPVRGSQKHEIFLRRDTDGAYLLSSRDDLEEFIDACRNDGSLSARLECDIILNDEEAFEGQHNLSTFESIYEGELEDMKGFRGDFDGNGHTLTGYVSCENLPVFYLIEKEGCVHDLTIDTSVFSPTYNKRKDEKTQYGASVTEVNYGTIKNVTVKGSVVGKGQAAGIAGVNEKTGLIENTVFSGKVTGGYGLKVKPDPGIQYAFDLVVIDNGRIVNSKANAVKMTAGPSEPYRFGGKGAKNGSEAGGDEGNTSKAGSVSEDSQKNGTGSATGTEAVSENGNSGSSDEDFVGPEKDIIVRLVKGDTLWHISRVYYGRGILYRNLKLRNKKGIFGGLEGHVLTRLPIGEEVLIPRIDNPEE
ncbi:MAG: hypothetical protein K6F86_04045 [Lachnospiraceae bacterium]|nr:hypothetical protein [Lachnospiraceae bacterium]